MTKRGDVIIIPPDDSLEIYTKEIPIGHEHIEAIQEYTKINKLNYNFQDDDYHFAPCTLALDGYTIIKIDCFMKQLLVYLPEKVSDRHLNYLKDNQSKYQNEYLFAGGYYINNEEFYRMHAVSEIITNAQIKNIEYHNTKKNTENRKFK